MLPVAPLPVPTSVVYVGSEYHFHAAVPVPRLPPFCVSVVLVPSHTVEAVALKDTGTTVDLYPARVTVEEELGQVPLEIVHLNTLFPTPNAVMPEVGLAGVVIAPAPLERLQSPVPITGVFPASVVVVPHTF